MSKKKRASKQANARKARRATNVVHENKIAKIQRHLRKHPEDALAKAQLKKLSAAGYTPTSGRKPQGGGIKATRAATLKEYNDTLATINAVRGVAPAKVVAELRNRALDLGAELIKLDRKVLNMLAHKPKIVQKNPRLESLYLAGWSMDMLAIANKTKGYRGKR